MVFDAIAIDEISDMGSFLMYSSEENADTSKKDTKLPFNFKDESFDPTDKGHQGGLYMNNPSNIKDSMFYNPTENIFEYRQKIGNMRYRNPSYMSFEEYMDYDMEKKLKDYWKQRQETEDKQNKAKSLIPKIIVNSEGFDRIFGGNTVDIRPSGAAEITFGTNTNKTENPAIAERNRRVTVLDFDQKIQLNVIGKIGDKLKTQINYDTEAAFDFQNQVKLDYTGYEDDIIKKIEAGNVSLPLQGSLISGSQALMGFKTQMQFGKTTVTTLLSQQRGKKQSVQVQGGTQITRFEVSGDNYDVNRHFFLSQYFRDNYNRALSNLPIILSNVNITKVEVYITNVTSTVDNTRNLVCFADLGESDRTSGNPNATQNQKWFNQSFVSAPQPEDATGPFPDSRGSNNLYRRVTSSEFNGIRDINRANNVMARFNRAPHNLALVQDYEVLERARKLAPTEYTFHPQLGYISLNSPLNNNEVLAVAYQYTALGKTYQVGEFSTDGVPDPQCLILKMLKASAPRIRLPIWDLMMKNIYAIGGFNINPKDFRLDVVYNDIRRGINLNYLTESRLREQILLQVCSLDSINNQQERIPDGNFDWIPGVTILPQNGRIIFPVIEPFGSNLKNKMQGDISGGGEPSPEDQEFIKKYVFQELYDSTKTAAQQIPAKNRFRIRGSYASANNSEINLNASNIPPGSVRVTSNGTLLTENQDYTVDYAAGKVRITNAGILSSNSTIDVQFENQQAFTPIVRNLIGTTIEHKFSKDLTFGGTFLRLTERPLTPKVTIGDEPVANNIYGVNVNYRTEAPWLTRLIDKIPLINTKEMSTINFTGEFAHLLPGHSRAISKEGISYIDDFEATQSVIDLRQQFNWFLASLPQGQPDLFPEVNFRTDLRYGYNRSKLSWYTVDPLFFQNNNLTPEHIRNNKALQSNHNTREVLEREVFPNRQLQLAALPNIPILDLAYFPTIKGPYNYESRQSGTNISAGLNADGTLRSPETRWGGIMRRIENNDFETANIEFVQIWMMDPFNEDNPNQSNSGELYINLGDVSEDLIPDNRKFFENGLSIDGNIDTTKISTTPWGRVPQTPAVVNAFDATPESRPFQDLGYDGLSDADEANQFSNYLSTLQSEVSPQAYARALEDPSSDNFKYFRSPEHDANQHSILERYKYFGNPDGNSSVDQPDGYPIQSTTLPNNEDINRDNNLNYNEAYFQYKIKISRENMVIGQNNITDIFETTINTADGRTRPIKWYQFKIPLLQPEKKVGEISDFRSIRFMRMFLRGFSDSIVIRLARLELIRGDWRRYLFDLNSPGEYISDDKFNSSLFDVAAVNIEENGSRVPVRYVLPPGIDRVIDPTQANIRQLNEQALVLRVCDLPDGRARAAYRNLNVDMRRYNKVRMFVHAEASQEDNLKKGDLTFFMRIGTDFDQNYYEIEMPVSFTPWGESNARNIWPLENEIDLDFKRLTDAKIQRNNRDWNLAQRYLFEENVVSEQRIYVVGNPNLAAVKTIMVGIRNPKKRGFQDVNDDGLPKCAEFWVNELRLTDFDQSGGWAATARLQAKLADFSDVTVTGSIRTQDFGGLEQKINERSQDNTFLYDISSTTRLQKFLPKDWNINLPMFLGFSEGFINPMFDPLNPDIRYRESLRGIEDEAEREERRRITQDYTKRKSINFTNVKKDKGKGSSKTHFYDIENITLSYSYNEVFRRNIYTENSLTQNHRGSLAYNLNTSTKTLKPFEKIKALKSDYFKLLTDLAIGTSLARASFRTDVERDITELKARNIEDANIKINTFFDKRFIMNRNYDMRYELTKSLNFDYSAINSSRIDEPQGRIDTTQLDPINRPGFTRRDSVIENLRSGGRTTQYQHTINANYNVPFNKFPLTNWITSSVKYTANYSWISAPPNILQQQQNGDTVIIANTITNSNIKSGNANLTFNTLYNKVPYLKKINNPPPKKPKEKKTPEQLKKEKEERKKMTKEQLAKLKAKEDSIKKAEKEINPIVIHTAKFLMMLKTATVTYSENRGTTLPGYLPQTKVLGLSDANFTQSTAPGIPFILGDQSNRILEDANKYGWITKSSELNTFFSRSYSSNFIGKINLEPVKDFKIELNWSRTATKNITGIYRYEPQQNRYIITSPNETGSYSISTIAWGTAFVKDDRQTKSSETFRNFLNNRLEISERIATERSVDLNDRDSSGYVRGYGKTQQDVLIPAFFAAYTRTPLGDVPTDFFRQMPKPNWRLTYDGLAKIESVKKYFKNLSINHAYRATFNIASYTTNQFFADDGFGNSVTRDLRENFLPQREIQVVTLSEQLSPFIGFDGTMQNSLLTKIDLKRDRNISLSLANSQITEIKTNEIVTGVGYRFKDVIPPFATRLGWNLKSDLNLRCDVSFRRNYTTIRQVETELNEITAGQRVISIRMNADYVINQRLNIRLFYDRQVTRPEVTTTFPTSNTRIGLMLRFTIAA